MDFLKKQTDSVKDAIDNMKNKQQNKSKGGNKLGGGSAINKQAIQNERKAENNNFKIPPIKNPFQRPPTKGPGQTLGGTKPGVIMSFTLSQEGPLGVKPEKTEEGGCIVAFVQPDSQAAQVGLLRGDVICVASIGQRPSDAYTETEIDYKSFLALVQSNQRPLVVTVRRIPLVTNSDRPHTVAGGDASAEARRNAMIAAAEARDKAYKQKMRIDKSKPRTKAPSEDVNAFHVPPEQSDETKRIIAEAKARETLTAQQLGYNPFEVARMTSGQAKTAVAVKEHGQINSNEGSDIAPTTRPPASYEEHVMLNDAFEEAYTSVVTSAHSLDQGPLRTAVGIMRKLVVNATTKGQQDDGEQAEKFRKVRLQNAKIQSNIVDIHGGLDLMMAFGFELLEDHATGETFLVYPFVGGAAVQDWIPAACTRLQRFENGEL